MTPPIITNNYPKLIVKVNEQKSDMDGIGIRGLQAPSGRVEEQPRIPIPSMQIKAPFYF